MAVYQYIRRYTPCPVGGTLLMNFNGDSITNGLVTTGGWRSMLLADIADIRDGDVGSSGVVDSLGGKNNALYGYDASTGTSASGYNNTSAAYWVANGTMANNDPGTVHLGTLHLGANDSASAGAAANAITLAAQWTALHPMGILFVANRLVSDGTDPTTWNSELATGIATMIRAGQNVVPVDLHAVIAMDDLYDGLHPNPVGNRKIANQWLAAMMPYIRA